MIYCNDWLQQTRLISFLEIQSIYLTSKYSKLNILYLNSKKTTTKIKIYNTFFITGDLHININYIYKMLPTCTF